MAQNLARGTTALICGSVAYDTILVFPDRFKAHILPDKLHTLNVSFLVPDMRREFGGCAANIAYGLNLLGDRGITMATAGELVFFGDNAGSFEAADARSGKALWHFNTGQDISASPMSYAIAGKQYVAIAAGGDVFSFALP